MNQNFPLKIITSSSKMKRGCNIYIAYMMENIELKLNYLDTETLVKW